ncbi:MAG: methylmalonyl-CoA carboxyltransferase, partial [Parvularculaceae bacterium]|nr:methylmalonyl-CoA carboxyltransferase [Parvularculaceae bacterium]
FLGEELSKEELGGVDIHTRNGVVDDEATDEEEAVLRARTFLSYLPSSIFELPTRGILNDSAERRDESLLTTVPAEASRTYSMRKVLDAVMDIDSVFEIGKNWGRAAITALARLDGWPVAVIANNPSYLGGSWTAKTSEKVERFVQLAEQFHLPVVNFVDNPGFMIGLEAEKSGVIRSGVRAMNAVYKASVPWATIITRKAYGIAGSAMSNHSRFQYRFAWPSGDWGSLPLDGGIEVAYKSELAASEDPQRALEEIRARLNKVRSPLRSAENFAIEDVIDPRETRPLLCEFAEHAQRQLHARL